MEYSEADIERIVVEVHTAIDQGNYRKATEAESMKVRLAALAALVKNMQTQADAIVEKDRELVQA